MAENLSTTYLTRTPDTPTNNKKYTLSVWMKVINQNTGDYTYIMSSDAGSTLREHIVFEDAASPFLKWYSRDSGSTVSNLSTNRVFQDPSAWYHLVFVYDSTAVEADRQKIYINGVRDTSFRTNTPLAADVVSQINNTTNPPKIGMLGQGTGSAQDGAFNGCMSHFHFCDGQTYDADTFGETDATSGIWKIKVDPTVTYGDNGFWIFKDASGVTDQSGNGNNWTENGAGITITKDNPSNNFATWNSLMNIAGDYTLTNANTTFTRTGNWVTALPTLGIVGGKWYWEIKNTSTSGDVYQATGIANGPTTLTQTQADWDASNNFIGNSVLPDCYSHYSTGSNSLKYNNNTSSTWGTASGAGPTIFMVAFDADNGTIWIGKDGTWMEGATQGEIEAGTTTNSMYTGITVNNNNPYFPVASIETGYASANFGNGYFGTTAVTSANADDAGIGAMEYEIPSGYYCLCTKNIGTQGG